MSSSIASAQKAGVSILSGTNEDVPAAAKTPTSMGFSSSSSWREWHRRCLSWDVSQSDLTSKKPARFVDRWQIGIPKWKRHLTCKNAMNSQENMWIGPNNSDTSQTCSSIEHIIPVRVHRVRLEPVFSSRKWMLYKLGTQENLATDIKPTWGILEKWQLTRSAFSKLCIAFFLRKTSPYLNCIVLKLRKQQF